MRRASRARALVALGAVALFALLAFAALLLVGAIADRGAAIPHDTHVTAGTSVGAGSEHDVPAAQIGHTTPNRLVMRVGGRIALDVPVDLAEQAWKTGLERYFTKG